MKQQKYNFKDLTLAYFQKKSKLYRAGGYKYATPLKRNLRDYQNHFFAFLMDVNICLLPVYIWVLEFLLIMCGLIPPHFFDLLFYLMFALLFVSSVLLLAFFTARTNGQSFGYAIMDLKLVRRNKKEAKPPLLRRSEAQEDGWRRENPKKCAGRCRVSGLMECLE